MNHDVQKIIVLDFGGQYKELIARKVPASKSFEPNLELKKAVYDKNFEVFKKLYKANKENFALLNK